MRGTVARKLLYIGAALGLLIFVLCGLLPSIFIGGLIGLKTASFFFGASSATEVGPRMVVAFFMIISVLVAASVFTGTPGLIGWLCGHIIDKVKKSRSYRVTIHYDESKMHLFSIQRKIKEVPVYIYTE